MLIARDTNLARLTKGDHLFLRVVFRSDRALGVEIERELGTRHGRRDGTRWSLQASGAASAR